MSQATLAGQTSIDYYASKDAITKTVTPGKEAADDDKFEKIATITLSGADVGTKYHCQGKYIINAEIKTSSDGEASEVKNQVQTADGKLYLRTKKVDGVTVEIKNDSEGQPDVSGVESIDHDIKSLLNENKVFWVTYDFDGTGSNPEGSIETAFKISNTKQDQNYLADKKITVTLTPDSGDGTLKCNIVEGD